LVSTRLPANPTLAPAGMVSHCLDLTQRWATWSSQNSLGLKVREPLARGTSIDFEPLWGLEGVG
jgi:hypothetical protein